MFNMIDYDTTIVKTNFELTTTSCVVNIGGHKAFVVERSSPMKSMATALLLFDCNTSLFENYKFIGIFLSYPNTLRGFSHTY